MNFPKYLSVKEVAKILSMKKNTVYEKINRGEIPGHFKLGGMHFFDEEELFKGLKSLVSDKAKTTSIKPKQTVDRHGLLG